MKISEAIKWIDNRMCLGRGQWTEHHQPIIDEPWQAGLMAIEALKATQWIPCSERLPNEDICNSYLIAWIPANEKVICGLPHYYQVADWEDGDWTNLDFCGHEEIVILAWMPLPKPWKGADDE